MSGKTRASLKKPPWLKVRVPVGGSCEVGNTLSENRLHTVCEEAHCPNRGECWGRGTATFLILGDTCTRSCRFCAVKTGVPEAVDESEPQRLLKAVKKMELNYVVITSVTRDDLKDGGAALWVDCIEILKENFSDLKIEVLVPDFNGNLKAAGTVFAARPDVLNHNIETVPSLYEEVRPSADYRRSLRVLREAYEFGLKTKSGLMLGMGEEAVELTATLKELFENGVRSLTLGQYMAPSSDHHPVARWVTPEEFEEWKNKARDIGFEHVESAPLVRSSYRAERNRSV